MMTAVIWCCVFNLFRAESCRVYAYHSGISLVTFLFNVYKRFFYVFNVFLFFFGRFLHLCPPLPPNLPVELLAFLPFDSDNFHDSTGLKLSVQSAVPPQGYTNAQLTGQ